MYWPLLAPTKYVSWSPLTIEFSTVAYVSPLGNLMRLFFTCELTLPAIKINANIITRTPVFFIIYFFDLYKLILRIKLNTKITNHK